MKAGCTYRVYRFFFSIKHHARRTRSLIYLGVTHHGDTALHSGFLYFCTLAIVLVGSAKQRSSETRVLRPNSDSFCPNFPEVDEHNDGRL